MKRHAVVALAMLFVAKPAFACEEGRGVRVPLGPADLGVLPEACEATEASIEGRASALIASSDLYGSLAAGLGLRGRLILLTRTWLSLWAPSLEYRYVANATVTADRSSLGDTALGIHHRLALRENLSLSPFVRVLLPTETGYSRSARWGFENGIAGTYRMREKLEFVGGYAFTLVSVVNGGSALSILGESISADVVYRPWRVFGVAGGGALRFVLGDREPFESFDPHLAARFYPMKSLTIALNAALPLWGRDRTNVGLGLSAILRF